VKSIQITIFEAVDGTRFDTAEKCVEHDVSILDQLLASLNPDLIKESLKRMGIIVRADRSVARMEPIVLVEAHKPPREIMAVKEVSS
jgi:hypothetical protein